MSARPTRRALLRTGLAAATAGAAGCIAQFRGRRDVTPSTTPGADPANTGTSQFRGGVRRWGFRPDVAVPDDVERAWELPDVNTGDHTAAKASAVRDAAGNVVLPGDSGHLWSLTPDGEVRWRTRVTDSTRGMHGTPAVADGVVFVGAYDGVMYAFDADSGQRRWRTDLGDAIGSSPGYLDGTVYIAVEHADPSGSMAALRADDGEVHWHDHRPTDHPHSTAAIDLDAGVLVVGSNDGKLYAWRFPELEFAWSFDAQRPIKGPIAVYDGAAVFGSWSDHVYSVALDTGEENWRHPTGGYVMSGASIDPERDVAYIGSHDGGLHCLNLDDGVERWSYATAARIVGCPAATPDRVVVGSVDGTLSAVEAADGAEVWQVAHDGYVTSTPLLADDGIYYAERAPNGGENGETGSAYKLVAA